ncbi:MAG: metallophosphoesterase [Lachnospiraceae bacterium]|nr:metallophosphoesterase [Lachnospiraceae bacterium]
MKIYIRSELEISHYKIHNEKVTKKTRLAVIADLHNCMCEDGGRQLFHVIEREEPDIVIIAGDFIDGSGVSVNTMHFLKLLAQRFNVIYGMGNHEKKLIERRKYKNNGSFELLRKTLNECGLKILSNGNRIIADANIKISGLDLPLSYFKRYGHVPLGFCKMRRMLGEIDDRYYNILIAHDPLHFISYSDYGADLVLSGHLHGGVMRLPFFGGVISPELKLFPKYDAGEFERNGSKMLVTKGLGMHTIHVRINDPTELMIVDISK